MTERWPAFASTDLIRALRKLGFLVVPGGKGSHTKLVHPRHSGALTIPQSKSLGRGIRAALLKQIHAMGVDLSALKRSL
ncbi:type II toxin-antitoxin system HicA family toxin [Candidatus Berkelbacteria bacterium]|nr:type II toxin-antitoxin system HicA family toxin [Candidatus Berkelbacteria bacterium]